MRPGLLISLILVVGAWGATSAAEDVSASRVAERASASGIAAEAIAPVLDVVRRSEAEGLPADLIVDKALEGLAKGVPPSRIAQAVSDLESRLKAAAEIVRATRPDLRPSDTRVVLEHLAAQIAVVRDPKAIETVAQSARGAALDVLFASTLELSRLMQRGVPTSAAAAAVSSLARAGYPASEIGMVSSYFDAYRREGGVDWAPFLAELGRRASRRESLRNMVNPFGDGATPLQRSPAADGANGLDARPGERDVRGQTALDQMSNGRVGEIPNINAPTQTQHTQP